jgi:3-isopropylmalate dehydrogenase
MTSTNLNIAVLPGDGIGVEVMDVCLEVLRVAQDKVGGFVLNLEKLDAGADTYVKTGVALPQTTFAAVDASDAVLLGAMGHPDVTYPDGTGIAPQLDLRFHYKLYAGVRPIRLLPGAVSALADPRAAAIDLVIIRESTEGLLGDLANGQVIEDRIARDTLVITRATSERLFDFAFSLARKRKSRGSRGAVTCVDKSDVLRSLNFFRKIFTERAARAPDIAAEYSYVDAAALNLVRMPWSFDVMVMENMHGDILSDLSAGLIGGMGMAPSADIGDSHAVFQPSHGTAPDIAGMDRANPTAMILSAAMMLDWLAERKANVGCGRAAALINHAVDEVYRTKRVQPREFGGADGTRKIGAEVASAIREASLS